MPRKQIKQKKAVARQATKSRKDVEHHHEQFFANNGMVLQNLNQLPSALRKMDAKTFMHHVNDEKNDFANWTEHVFGEKKLAKSLRSEQTKTGTMRILRRNF